MIKKIILHGFKNIRNTFLAVLPTKLFELMIDSASQLFFTEEKIPSTNLVKHEYCKVIKEHFNRNLVMSAEDKEIFQTSNMYWICDNLFDVGDNKVRDHCHVTGKYTGCSHWSCNINVKLTKKKFLLYFII